MVDRSDSAKEEDTRESAQKDPGPELARLLELATKYPEIGPPLAELAFKIGQAEFADRVVRMGLEGGGPGVEYFFVAANAARREGRYQDALRTTVEAVRAYASAPEDKLAPDDGTRLLHLVRLGFATLMFDVKDIHAHPEFAAGLAEALPGLEARLGADPFYRALLAQALWFGDRARSEAEWDRAAAAGAEAELTWNARGTWYKEAERDLDKAERAYRQGLESAPRSPLLFHNVAQILIEKAGRADVPVDGARRLLREADELLRAALREEGPKGLRRHVHATRDRLNALRSSLPPRGAGATHAEGEGRAPAEEEKPPRVGEVVRGRVTSLTIYGAFVSLGGGIVGLLHKTEMAHEPVDAPAQLLAVGDEVEVRIIDAQKKGAGGRWRVGLSRRALLPVPEGAAAAPARPAPRQDRERGGAGGGGGRRGLPGREGERDRERERGPRQDRPEKEKFLSEGKVSLGEMILARLKESQGSKP